MATSIRQTVRAAMLSGSSIAAVVALAHPTAASAQAVVPTPPASARITPPPPPTSAAATDAVATDPQASSASSTASPSDDITVVGTRIVRDGYSGTQPVSVIGEADIQAKAPANIADFVNTLPSMAPTQTPRANVGFVSAGLVGINALNLRNLGANRTLVLLDGQRVGPSTISGLVDVNNFPQALVKRVDVVTGGASADWGSDAVAGVVNFVLDTKFTGIKGQVQGGVTTYGDDRNYDVSLSAGFKFADDRGHVLLSGEVAHNDGITSIGDRKWYNYAKLFANPANPSGTAGNGQPQFLNLPGSGFATVAPGGIITSGALRGTYFGAGGTPTQFNYGSIVSGNFMNGGDYRVSDFGLSGDLDAHTSRQAAFGRISYDFGSRTEVFAQLSYNRATSFNNALAQFNFANITIQPDNAFIPTSIKPLVTGTFTLGTTNGDLGPITATSNRQTWRGVVGAKGGFDAFGTKWSWDVYGQETQTRVYTAAHISITANFNRAIDAVRNANGAIVCRSTLTDPTNGCVPYNVFGTGVNGDATRNYVLGTTYGRTRLTEDVVAGTLRGDPFSTWAGPVSIATGVEHRREAVTGSNDPLTTATVKPYFAGNFFASNGSYNVTEAFLETVVPFAKDAPFAKSLDFNGAVRSTWYSTSGYVTTWKGGLTWSPVSDITFRATRSRDIRAGNLAELFQAGQTSTTSIADPANANQSTTLSQVTSGNANLRPEKADTLGLGMVLQPSFLPGFAASVDYYNIDVKDAIVTYTAAVEVNQCFLGNTAFCSQITRGGPAGNGGVATITSVQIVPVNVAKQTSRGLDFEASYRTPAFGGNFSIRGLATRYLKNYSNDGITPATDTVGTNGTNGTLKNSLPTWRYSATVAFEGDRIGASLTGRGVSAGVYNTAYIECTTTCPVQTAAQAAANPTINNNRLPGAFYLDGSVTIKLPHNVQAYLAIDNIANKDPAQMAFGPGVGIAPLSINPVVYDVLGRVFRIGVRFRM